MDLSNRAGCTLVALFWLAQVLVNSWWLKVDTRPPVYDTAGHAIAVLQLAEARFVAQPSAALQRVLGTSPYPPFVYLVSLPFALVLGPSVDAFLGSHALFMAILLFATYALGRRLDRPRTGVAAAFLVGMYPILYGLSRHYVLDIPLVAMVTLALCFLAYSEDFQRLLPSVLFGVSLGLGMLTKWTFALFASAPLAVSLQAMLLRTSPRRLRNACLAVGLGSLIAGPWYLVHLADLQSFLRTGGLAAAALEGDPSVRSLEAWIYYANALVNHHLFVPFATLFAVGLVWVLAKCGLTRPLLVLLAWVVVPYVVLSNFANKDIRYMLPCLPAISLITALGLGQIRSAKTARVLWAAVAAYALVQFAGLTFGTSHRLHTRFVPPRVSLHLGAIDLTLYQEVVHIASPPRAEDWRIQAILADILQDSAARPHADEPIALLVLPKRSFFERQGFQFYAMADRLPIQVSSITRVLAKDTAGQLEAADYVVTKTGSLGPAWTLQDAVAVTRALQSQSSDLSRRFVQFGEYPLPDGSIAQLYRHERTGLAPPTNGSSTGSVPCLGPQRTAYRQ